MFQNISLSVEDLDNSEWQTAISDCAQKDCGYYVTRFASKAREALSSGNNVNAEVFTLLDAACSLYFRLDNISEPFGPMFVFGNQRSAILEDFGDLQLEIFNKWIPVINEPEIRARLSDIVWLRQHDYRTAQSAVDAYLESASILENPEQWSTGYERIERALQISAQLGRKTVHFRRTITYIEEVLDKYQGTDPLFFSERLMNLLIEYGQGDVQKYVSLAEIAALRGETEQNWHKARSYWEIISKWHLKDKNLDAIHRARLRLAETYVHEAETATSRPDASYLVASKLLQQGIEAFRRAGNSQDKINELHKLLLDYQAKSLNEMKPISAQIDIQEIVEQSRKRVAGKPITEALFELAFIAPLPNKSEIRLNVEDMLTKTPFRFLVSSARVDSQGKVIARDPRLSSTDKGENDAVIRADMYREVSDLQRLYAQAYVSPAIHKINEEHHIRVYDLISLVSDNPFIPPGREQIFAQGLHAGLIGNLIVSAHLLIPQIENSLRYLLSSHGFVASKLDKDGIQEERQLGELLSSPEIEEILGEDMVFSLQGLLTERYGTNLRNVVSHGLLDSDNFNSLEVIYFWWLTLYLSALCKVISVRHSNLSGKPVSE